MGPEDQARAERFVALRARRWPTQGAFVKASGLDRIRVSRLESGQDRFTAPEFQDAVAQAVGLKTTTLVGYMRGQVDLATAAAEMEAGRRVELDPGQARPSDDGRWRDYADRQPAFLRLATKVRARAELDQRPLRMVEGALDDASDQLRNFGGGELTDADVKRAYDDAWAFLSDEEPAPLKVPERPVTSADDGVQKPRRSIRDRAESLRSRKAAGR